MTDNKQIINQVRESYLEALRDKNQDTLSGGAFKAVFKIHRRDYAESLYQHGATSTTYWTEPTAFQYSPVLFAHLFMNAGNHIRIPG